MRWVGDNIFTFHTEKYALFTALLQNPHVLAVAKERDNYSGPLLLPHCSSSEVTATASKHVHLIEAM